MLHVRCPEEREHVADFSTSALLLCAISAILHQVFVYTVLDRSYDALPFLENLVRERHNCAFERGMWTALRPTFAGWHKV